MVDTRSPFNVASQGLWAAVWPTSTQRESLAQARAFAWLASDALFHKRANVVVRTTSDPDVAETSATHCRCAQVSEVSVVHVVGTGRTVHVVPASWVTSRSACRPGFVLATRQLSASVQDNAVMDWPTVQVIGSGVVQVVPPSLVKESRAPPVMPVVSTMAHEEGAKQLTALTPRPAWGVGDTDTDWVLGPTSHSASPEGLVPPTRH
jgi:hypothetical protein